MTENGKNSQNTATRDFSKIIHDIIYTLAGGREGDYMMCPVLHEFYQ